MEVLNYLPFHIFYTMDFGKFFDIWSTNWLIWFETSIYFLKCSKKVQMFQMFDELINF